MVTILVAEDEKPIREGLKDLLEAEGYTVLAAPDGEAAVDLFMKAAPDLALLDIMMPKLSGYDVCREIRKRNERLPIIFLTAKEEEIDKVVGLELGADDYIVKPFGVRELLARIRTILRRAEKFGAAGTGKDLDPSGSSQKPYSFGKCRVDPVRFTLLRNGQTYTLGARENALLSFFFTHPEEILSRDFLLDRFWGLHYGGTTRTLDQHIAKLRRKVEENPARPVHILTVHGTGYRFYRGE
ncbi:MAG: response regulator transcription factor [Spirochaetales bacterium]|nr:response regulator transcription factor [Spirochaetales bacterium]